MAQEELEITFLNLDDCNPEEREKIRAILKPSPQLLRVAAAANVGIKSNNINIESPLQVPFPNGIDNVAHYHSGQAYIVSSDSGQPSFQQTYSTSTANVTTPAAPACVFINNVTANVNVHHGAHLQQEEVQPQMSARPCPIQQYQGQPMPHPPGPPAPGMLPTPHFPSGSTAPGVTLPGPYMAPFGTQHHLTAMSKANAVQTASMYPSIQHVYHQQFYSPIHFAAAMAPYPQTMVGSMPHLPVTQVPPPMPMIRSQPPNPMTPGPPVTMIPHSVAPASVIKAYLSNNNVNSTLSPVVNSAGVVLSNESQYVMCDVHHEGMKVKIEADQCLEVRENCESVNGNQMVNETHHQGVYEEFAEESHANNDRYGAIEEEISDEGGNQEAEETSHAEKVEAAEAHSLSAPPSSTKSWASLFHKETQDASSNPTSSKPMALIHPYSVEKGGHHDGIGKIRSPNAGLDGNFDSKDAHLALFLQKYVLNHKSQSLKPRGLSNRSNWCFVNAILQALVACPPFFNLMKSLPENLIGSDELVDDPSPVKILRAVYAFTAEFAPLDNFPKLNRRDKNKKNDDLPMGKSFEACSIFKVLLNMNTVIEGRQEDAEEFLTFLLNGLNDEMLALLKLLDPNRSKKPKEEVENSGASADDNEWLEVGPKNRGCITRREGQSVLETGLKTPLAEMFKGQVRSCVTRSGGEPTATLQPFFTLQLDIQSDLVRNVANALNHNFTVETLDGYVCPKTKQEIEASRSLQLEELPPILILHLKRFVYDETSGGCQKLLKNIDFPVDLDIPKDILSPNSRNKYQSRQKSYKLFAVVYHDGTEATKGHYVTDVYHTGLSTWLHCDDSNIKSVSEATVLAHSARSLPYILFYRRGDTIVGLDKAKK